MAITRCASSESAFQAPLCDCGKTARNGNVFFLFADGRPQADVGGPLAVRAALAGSRGDTRSADRVCLPGSRRARTGCIWTPCRRRCDTSFSRKPWSGSAAATGTRPRPNRPARGQQQVDSHRTKPSFSTLAAPFLPPSQGGRNDIRRGSRTRLRLGGWSFRASAACWRLRLGGAVVFARSPGKRKKSATWHWKPGSTGSAVSCWSCRKITGVFFGGGRP